TNPRIHHPARWHRIKVQRGRVETEVGHHRFLVLVQHAGAATGPPQVEPEALATWHRHAIREYLLMDEIGRRRNSEVVAVVDREGHGPRLPTHQKSKLAGAVGKRQRKAVSIPALVERLYDELGIERVIGNTPAAEFDVHLPLGRFGVR